MIQKKNYLKQPFYYSLIERKSDLHIIINLDKYL